MPTTRYAYWPAFLTLLGLLLTGLAARAQAPAWQSLTPIAFPASTYTTITATASGSAGEVYAVGYFSGTATFGTIALTSAGDNDLFVARWDESAHAWAWAQRAGGPGDDRANAVAVSNTTVYVTGNFYNTATFGTTSLTAITYAGVFAAKLTTTSTTATWAWALGSTGAGSREGSALAVRGSSVYVGGWFGGNAVFGPYSLLSRGAGDGFVAKLTDAGATATWTWAQALGGNLGDDTVVGLAAGEVDIYLTGNTKSISPVFGSATLAPTGAGPMYVAKLTDAGPTASFAWAQLFGSLSAPTNVYTATLVLGLVAQGSTLYLLGNYTNAAVQLGSFLLPNAGFYDAFVAKVSDTGTSGTFVWAQRFGGTNHDTPFGFTLSGSSLYVTGTFSSPTVSFGPTILATTGTSDLFITKLDDAGATAAFAWAQRAGGAGNAIGTAVSVSSLGTVCVSSTVQVPASFGSLPATGPAQWYATSLATLRPATGLPTTAAAPLAGLTVAPNPVSAPLAMVQLPAGLAAGPATLTLLDAVGRVVRTRLVLLPAGSPQATLDVAGLAPGVYALRVAMGESLGTVRLVVE